LIQACRDVLGSKPLIEQLDSYRYPLSGEFAADMDALQDVSACPVAGAWRSLCCARPSVTCPESISVRWILAFHFEHRHRSLSHEEVGVNEPGLITAAADVARCLAFQVLRESEPRSAESLMSLIIERYRSRAQEWQSRYEHVALLNGLRHDAR
jgi:glucosyl-3-phosphoglycerate synthase